MRVATSSGRSGVSSTGGGDSCTVNELPRKASRGYFCTCQPKSPRGRVHPWMERFSVILVFWPPGKEGIGPPNIFRIPRTALVDALFQQWHARDADQQHRHDEWADDAPPGTPGGGQPIESPPDAEIPKIIGMPRKPPESQAQALCAIPIICFESRQLRIAAPLKDHSCRP